MTFSDGKPLSVIRKKNGKKVTNLDFLKGNVEDDRKIQSLNIIFMGTYVRKFQIVLIIKLPGRSSGDIQKPKHSRTGVFLMK